MNSTNWPCGTQKSHNNVFTGYGLPERKATPAQGAKRVDLTPRHDSPAIGKSDPIKLSKLLKASI